MIRIAITLAATASVSYLILPMLKAISYWQSTIIFFCLITVCVLVEMRNQRETDLALASIRQDAPKRQPQPDTIDQAAQMAEILAGVIGGVTKKETVAPTAPVSAPVTPPKSAGFYALEATTLTGLLQTNYGLNVIVEPTGFVKAPRFVAYQVTQTGALKFKRLREAESDLAREVNDIHRNHKFGPTQIIFTDTQPIWLQISNPKPYDLLWADRHQLWKPKPLQAILGHYYNGAQALPLIVDIKGKETSFTNGAWFGQPGAGKSTSLHEALCSLLEYTPPTQLQVWGIDLAKDVFAQYEGLPHLTQHTSNVDEAIIILDQFCEWCKAGNAPKDGIHRLLVIDECQDLITHAKHGKAVLERLTDILSKGREFGIRVWMATQNPDQNSYPSTLKPKTHFMACGFILNDNYVSSQLGIYGASKIVEKQELIFQGPFGMYRVSMFRFTAEDRGNMTHELIKRWGYADYRRSMPLVDPVEPSAPVPPATTPVAQPMAPALGAHKKWGLPHRALTEAEEEAIIVMVKAADPATKQFHTSGKVSINKVIDHVYKESKNSEKIRWVKACLVKGELIDA